MTQINGEPACADYLQLREGVQPDDPVLDDRGEEPTSDSHAPHARSSWTAQQPLP
jgi:hypothetical protein